jgi:hypothetical protein
VRGCFACLSTQAQPGRVNFSFGATFNEMLQCAALRTASTGLDLDAMLDARNAALSRCCLPLAALIRGDQRDMQARNVERKIAADDDERCLALTKAITACDYLDVRATR